MRSQIKEVESNALLKAADVVTLARTAVERDYAGNLIDAHAPEMPTRFAKQLAQIVRGGVAIGMTRERAFALALRCARDSIPPCASKSCWTGRLRAEQVNEVSESINKPWNTVKRELSALTMLGISRRRRRRRTTRMKTARAKPSGATAYSAASIARRYLNSADASRPARLSKCCEGGTGSAPTSPNPSPHFCEVGGVRGVNKRKK